MSLTKAATLIDRINEWCGKALYPLMLAISLIVFAEVIFRYFLNSPLSWSHELSLMIFALCSVLSGGHVEREGGHIRVDILYGLLPPKWKAIMDILTFPFFLIFIGAFFYFACSFAYESLSKLEHTHSVWNPPIYPIKTMMPIGALLVLLQGIVTFMRNISRIRRQKESGHGAEEEEQQK